jgi:hypothetical protein
MNQTNSIKIGQAAMMTEIELDAFKQAYIFIVNLPELKSFPVSLAVRMQVILAAHGYEEPELPATHLR